LLAHRHDSEPAPKSLSRSGRAQIDLIGVM